MSRIGKRSKAEQIQLEIFRRMTPQERLDRCFRWTNLTCELARSTIRSEHPDWTPAQVDRELGRRITGIGVERLVCERNDRRDSQADSAVRRSRNTDSAGEKPPC